MTTPDPAALFRTWLGEWEKMANRLGGEALRSAEWVQAMHQAQGAALAAQAANREAMERALTAASMPTSADIEDLSARLARVEESLARIEARLGATDPRPDRVKPPRTRKPPQG